MFDISRELVMCDGMVMSRRDAVEYMKGRLSLPCPGSHSSWFNKSGSVVSEERGRGLLLSSPLFTPHIPQHSQFLPSSGAIYGNVKKILQILSK